MVEQTDASEGHGNAVLVAGIDNMIVTNATTSLCNVLNTTLVGTFNIVTEWEEGIATQTYIGVLCNPLFLFLACERLGLLCEEFLPFTIGQHIHVIVADIDVDGVVAIGTTDIRQEGKCHYLGVLTQPPDISLAASQAGTVDTTLLPCSDTNGLTVLNVAYTVALGVLQSDESNDKVALGICGEILVLGGNVLEESGIIQLNLVATLFKGNAKDLLTLYRLGLVGGVNLDNVVSTLALLAQNLQSLFRKLGSDNAITYLGLDEQGYSYGRHRVLWHRHKPGR